jgi:hypothetical protein
VAGTAKLKGAIESSDTRAKKETAMERLQYVFVPEQRVKQS